MDKLRDKVVGIIGTGATAVQAVPKLAEASKQLYVFQRTPSTVSERNQRDTDPEWFAEMSSKPGWHEERMENFIACTTGGNPDVDLVDDGWTEMFAVDTKRQPATRPRPPSSSCSTSSRWSACASGSSTPCRIPRPPRSCSPWYKMSCKRPCFHDDYLPTFNRDNVTLVDTDGRGVERHHRAGLGRRRRRVPGRRASSTRRASSSPTFYTHRLGFDPVGEGGMSLSESWAHGAYTLHGIFSHGFPNLCMNSAIQGGQHINIAYAATKIARAHRVGDRPVARRRRDRRSRRSTPRRSGSSVHLRRSRRRLRHLLRHCTPGYLNNENQMPRREAARNLGAYAAAPSSSRPVLAAWRDEAAWRDGRVPDRR